MPHGLQTTTFAKLNITGGAFEAVSPVSGDSATFYNVPQGSEAYIGEIWAVDNVTLAEWSITATRFHDQSRGIRGYVPAGSTLAPANKSVCLSSIGIDQKIYPSDVLTVQVNGTANDDVVLSMLIYYRDLPGISARLASYDYVAAHTKNLVGINVSITPGAAALGTGVALNATDNRLHANTDYALLGFTATLPINSLVVQGIDTGNLRVGGPVLADPDHDGTMFVDYARSYNAPLIPIINANNAGATTLYGVATVASATLVDVLLAELDGPFTG